jgi:N-acetylglucosaminyldiphosphoundecaprenol N-acetyl-beta-D-mannosaminyltransferase
VARALRQRFPSIEIVGMHATPTRPPGPAENAQIVADIEGSRADIVWVGMGTPPQDEWMRANVEAVGIPMIGVGSAFDLLSGRTRAAPAFIKHSGLQWAFRLAQEPRRLMRRYANYNPRFVARVIPEIRRRRSG